MFQDIRQSRRSLREVLPGRQTPVSRSGKVKTGELIVSRSNRFSPLIFLLIIIVVVIGVVAISSLFSGAKIFVMPKSANLAFDKTVIDYTPVESMTFIPISESATLVATGQERISEKATGQVVIYNNYSTVSQKLIATTRLESKAGKIYRLVETITVPGQKTVAGKVTPADVAGEDYNSPLTDFTIPGFKGGPRYDKFYARSKTPVTGGLIGSRPVVIEAEKSKAIKDLRASLIPKMLTQSRAQIPENFILYDSATNFEFNDKLVAGNGTSSQATLTSTISGTAYLLEEGRLITVLLASQSNDLNGLSVTMPNLRFLDVKIDSDKLTVTGTTKAVARVDANRLASALADQPKSQAGAIFNQFAEIQTAKVNLFPSWLRRFPQDPAKIKVELSPAS